MSGQFSIQAAASFHEIYRTSYLLYNTQCNSIVETVCGFSKALSDDDNPYSHEMLKNISAACVNERDFL